MRHHPKLAAPRDPAARRGRQRGHEAALLDHRTHRRQVRHARDHATLEAATREQRVEVAGGLGLPAGVLAGHGPPGGPEVIVEMIDYLEGAQRIHDSELDEAAFRDALLGGWPDRRGTYIVEVMASVIYDRR